MRMAGGFVWWVGVALAVLIVVADADARGGRVGGGSIGPGFGSNPRSYAVRPYVRRDGASVLPHRRSAPNPDWRDNWSTNRNTNPYTGRMGTRVNPPQK
jgi:hypothetical protein